MIATLQGRLKGLIKQATMYSGSAATEIVREHIAQARREGWPYCPPDEGDLLHHLAEATADQNALEVGFATGSTAAYILTGLRSGILTSIDYDQNFFERAGEQLVARMGLSGKHRLVEDNSIRCLPRLHDSGARFGLIFLDGWKTFDHVWVDTFYCARMLNVGGYVCFDDARMDAVRKCISLLKRYYGFKEVDGYAPVGGVGQRVWHLLSSRSLRRPYVVLQKVIEIEASEAARAYDFWRSF